MAFSKRMKILIFRANASVVYGRALILQNKSRASRQMFKHLPVVPREAVVSDPVNVAGQHQEVAGTCRHPPPRPDLHPDCEGRFCGQQRGPDQLGHEAARR